MSIRVAVSKITLIGLTRWGLLRDAQTLFHFLKKGGHHGCGQHGAHHGHEKQGRKGRRADDFLKSGVTIS